MIVKSDLSDPGMIKNPAFREYAQIYSKIQESFIEHVRSFGMEFDAGATDRIAELRMKLQAEKVKFRNNNHSIYRNWISPACSACSRGENSSTFYLSLQCHRQCYYCFNPNQQDYEEHRVIKRDCVSEMREIRRSGGKLSYIALTGGEPLLHKEETLRFFKEARRNFPGAHTRLYTSGDLLDKELLEELGRVRLDEIRFSIKMEDSLSARVQILEKIRAAQEAIPAIVVEMPVIPGTLPEMKLLLQELDASGVAGINLLEFCFPYHNAQEFHRRGFRLKNPPFEVLYDYWYAGGLPIAGSEEESLELLRFASERGLSLGVHYCSLENKLTGQIFQQNQLAGQSRITYVSPKDYFIKTAKVFGDDIRQVVNMFRDNNMNDYEQNEEYHYLEFPVHEVSSLRDLPVEVAITTHVMEIRNGEPCRRELKIERICPEQFEMDML